MAQHQQNHSTAALLRNRLARKLQLVDAELTTRNEHDGNLILAISKMDDMLGQLLRKVQAGAKDDSDNAILAYGKEKNAVVVKAVTATAGFKDFLDNYLRAKGIGSPPSGGGPPAPPPPGGMPMMEETRDGQQGDEEEGERHTNTSKALKRTNTLTAAPPRKVMVLN